MPADRPLRNLTRELLLGAYTELLSEPSSKKYNLRKEFPTDKRAPVVHSNRWLARDEYLEMVRQEILARGLDLPADAAPAAEPPPPAEAEPAAAEPPPA